MLRVRHQTALGEPLLVLALTVAAAVARLVALGDSPPGLQGDEAWLGIEARRILEDGPIGVWTPAAWGQPAGVFYWTALWFALFSDSVTVLRASVAVLGVATIPALYLFVRSWYGPRAALMGAALLTASYWHVHFSRTAYPLTAVPLVESLVLFLLALAWKRQSWWLFLLSGVLTGAGVYTYRGYLLFLPVLAVVWLMILAARPYSRRRLLAHGAVFVIVAAAVAAPFGSYVLTHRDEYANYGTVVSIFENGDLEEAAESGETARFLGKQLRRGLELYFVGGAPDFTDGTGTRAILDPVTAVLFALGLVISLKRIREPGGLLIVAGVLAGVAAIAITVEWGSVRRNIVALPMVFAAAGVAGSEIMRVAGQLLAPRTPHSLRLPGRLQAHPQVVWPQVAIAVIVLAFAISFNTWVYTQRVLESRHIKHAYHIEITEAAKFIQSLPDSHVYFYSNRWSWDYETRQFLAPDSEGEDRSTRFGEYSLTRSHHVQPVVYMLLGEYADRLSELEQRYPGGRRVEKTHNGNLVFAAYLVDVSADGTG